MRRSPSLLVASLTLLSLLVACQSLRMGDGLRGPSIPSPPIPALRVTTYNVHYIDLDGGGGPWSVEGWEARREALETSLDALNADAIAFQEMESHAGGSFNLENLALDFLLERNPHYAAAAVGDPRTFPSTQPILYRPDRLEVIDEGWFHFSETPTVVYSRGFDGASPSFASWARFRLRGIEEGTFFTLINVHFDYGFWTNRRRSALLTAAFARERISAGERLILVGDVNATEGSATMEILRDAGLEFPSVDGATYHFNRGLNLFGAIDRIGFSDGVAPVGEPVVLRAKFGGAWPSDHYPVALDLAFD